MEEWRNKNPSPTEDPWAGGRLNRSGDKLTALPSPTNDLLHPIHPMEIALIAVNRFPDFRVQIFPIIPLETDFAGRYRVMLGDSPDFRVNFHSPFLSAPMRISNTHDITSDILYPPLTLTPTKDADEQSRYGVAHITNSFFHI
jgi:hypothetical protein